MTEKGTIRAEHVVNAAGLWAKQVGRMVGLELPVSPLAHHYLVTESIPEIEALDFEVPMTVDLEGFTYLRQDQKGVLVGIYEIVHQHWNIDGARLGLRVRPDPGGYRPDRPRTGNGVHALSGVAGGGCQELGERRLHLLARRQSAGRTGSRAAELLAGLRGDGGIPAGRRRRQDARRMDDPRPSPRPTPGRMDIARYGPFASNRDYIRQTTGQFYSRRFVMTYPNEQLPAGRPLNKAPAHDAMKAAGALWGVSWGLEVPLVFGPEGFEETPTLKRSNAFELVGEECRAVREGVGLLDITGFSRYEVTGRDAEAWLDRVMAGRLPRPGRVRLSPHARAGRPPEGRPHDPELGATALGGSWAPTICANGTCAGSTTVSTRRATATFRCAISPTPPWASHCPGRNPAACWPR